MAAAAGILHLEQPLFLADENPQIDQDPSARNALMLSSRPPGLKTELFAIDLRSTVATNGWLGPRPASAEAQLDTAEGSIPHGIDGSGGLQFVRSAALGHPDQQVTTRKPACSRRNKPRCCGSGGSAATRRSPGPRTPPPPPRSHSIERGREPHQAAKPSAAATSPARLMAGIPSRKKEKRARRHAASPYE